MWKDSDPLAQLPHFEHSVIKAYKRQLKNFQIPSGSINNFCKLTPEQRKELKLFDNEQKLRDVEATIKTMPLCSTTFTAFVEGKEENEPIVTTDMITLKIKTTFDLLASDEQPGYVHSERFGFLKLSKVFFLVVDAATKERLVVQDNQVAKSNTVEFELKQRF